MWPLQHDSTTMATSFSRLVRFKASGGQIFYGDAGDDWETNLEGKTVQVFTGLDPWDSSFRLSDKTAVVEEVSMLPSSASQKVLKRLQILCPLEAVPVILGIGLNYRGHATEAGVSLWNFHPRAKSQVLPLTTSVPYPRISSRVHQICRYSAPSSLQT